MKKLRECDLCGQDYEMLYPSGKDNRQFYCSECRRIYTEIQFTPREQLIATLIATGAIVFWLWAFWSVFLGG